MLSVAEQQQFQAMGFLAFERLLNGTVLNEYMELFESLVEKSAQMPQNDAWCFELNPDGTVKQPRTLHKIQGVGAEEPDTLNIAREAAICSRVAQLLGTSLDIFGTKFFPLLPGSGPSTRWHQDSFFFNRTSVEEIISCAIYYEDTDRDNGCLRVVPGSHRAGPLEHVQDRGSYGSWVDVDESQATFLEVPAGTVVLFSSHLLHGADRNTSARSRFSTAWHYISHDLALEGFERGVYRDRHHVWDGEPVKEVGAARSRRYS